MKSATKRLLVEILTMAMVFTLLPATVFAAGTPTITQQPSDVTANEGTKATFAVEAQDAESYLWQTKTSSTGNWIDTSFETSRTATLSVPVIARRDGYQYRCKVTNSEGSVYSEVVTLTVVPAVNITSHPQAVTKDVGDTAVFTVTAENAESYHWYVRTSADGTFKPTSFATSKTATLEVPVTLARNGYEYKCRVDNSGGGKFSRGAVLTVNQAIVIDTQPMSSTVGIGETASFTVKASSKCDLTYQWQTKTSSTGKWTNTTFTGSQTPTVKVPVIARRNGYQYRCKITNGVATKYSSVATLEAYGVTKHPADATVTENNTVTFSVTAVGDVARYQWQTRKNSTASWSETSNSDTANYSFEPSLSYNGYQFRCVVTFAYDGVQVASDAATLTVNEDENLPEVTWVTYPQSSIRRAVGERLNLTATVRGGKAPYTFEWKQSNYNGSETKYYRGKTSTGKGTLTKVCETADFNSTIFLTVTDSLGQTVNCPIFTPVAEYKPIGIRVYPDGMEEVIIDKDDSTTSHFIDTRFSSLGSGKYTLEWQYACTTKSKTKLSDSDFTKVTAKSPFSLPSYGNFAVTVSESDALYSLMDSGNLYLRCKAVDVERNVTAYTDIVSVVYGEVEEEISDTP